MKLWLLKNLKMAGNYNTMQGIVVRAKDEQAARKMASESVGTHTRDVSSDWLDATATSCEQLSARGKPEVIIIDFYEP